MLVDGTFGSLLSGLWASFALFVPSLILPSLYFENGESYPGFAAFFLGWLGASHSQFGWYANLVWALAAGALVSRRSRFCMAAAILAVAIAMDSFRLIGESVRGDLIVSGLGPGFYVWVASMLVLAVLAAVLSHCLRFPATLRL